MRRNRKLVVLAGALAIALAAGACSSASDTGSGSAVPPAASGSLNLKGVCPDTVVVATNWWPQAEHGAFYQLLGPGYKIDAAHKSVTGPLVAGGKSTGVQIELQAGGPAVGFQPTEALMYQNPRITLGMAPSDALVQFSKTQPVIAVAAPLDLDPQILLWDPASHPNWHTIADIGQTNEKVLYFQTGTYMEYLIGSGILRRSQIDGSYDGSPSAFVASGGKIAVQGFATNEPYLYRHEVKNWDKPVAFQLITDTGYPNYGNTVIIRADKKTELTPCLKRLVPIIQQGQVDFMNSPGRAIDTILKVNDAYKGTFLYSRANAQFAVDQMRRLGIVGNGQDNTLGNFDQSRIQKLISIVGPIFMGQKKAIKPNLTPADIVTNEFIDPSIALKS